jgi:hypothetical protein
VARHCAEAFKELEDRDKRYGEDIGDQEDKMTETALGIDPSADDDI